MRKLILLFSLLALFACAGSLSQRQQRAFELADAAGMSGFITRGELPLRGFRRIDAPGEPVWVFIEGDGLAWVTPSQPSRDPTPITPVALQLAVADPASNRVWLARPGQYQKTLPHSRYWLEARFAEGVVEVFEAAIIHQLENIETNQVFLVGYSGGAAIAALLAQRFVDHQGIQLKALLTVAGNLDHAAWTDLRGLTPLRDSLNPIDRVERLAALPQRHLLAEQDEQVPGAVIEGFVSRLPDPHCAEIIRLPLSHTGPWTDNWLNSRAQPMPCGLSGR